MIGGTILAVATAVALGWKWQLGIVWAGLLALAVSMPVAIGLTAMQPVLHFTTVTGTLAIWGVTVAAGLAALLVVFFRDPERVATGREDVDSQSR